MADDLISTLGAKLLISHTFAAPTQPPGQTITASGGKVHIALETAGPTSDVDPTVVEIAGSPFNATADPITPAVKVTLKYLWTPPAAGRFRFVVLPTTDAEAPPARGRILVWPLFSRLDRYIARIQGWLQETEVGEAQQQLSLRDYEDALRDAVAVYTSGDSTPATLTHETDGLPAGDFGWISAYAAGLCLIGPAAAKAAATEAPEQAMAFVRSYDSKADKFLRIGKGLMALAEAQWKKQPVESVVTAAAVAPVSVFAGAKPARVPVSCRPLRSWWENLE